MKGLSHCITGETYLIDKQIFFNVALLKIDSILPLNFFRRMNSLDEEIMLIHLFEFQDRTSNWDIPVHFSEALENVESREPQNSTTSHFNTMLSTFRLPDFTHNQENLDAELFSRLSISQSDRLSRLCSHETASDSQQLSFDQDDSQARAKVTRSEPATRSNSLKSDRNMLKLAPLNGSTVESLGASSLIVPNGK